MNKTIILGISSLFFALPLMSFASTFLYVNANGSLGTVAANDANQALLIAPNIAANSGVLLLTNDNQAILVVPPTNTLTN